MKLQDKKLNTAKVRYNIRKHSRVRKIFIFRLKNQETNKSKTKNIESKDATTKLKSIFYTTAVALSFFFNKM